MFWQEKDKKYEVGRISYSRINEYFRSMRAPESGGNVRSKMCCSSIESNKQAAFNSNSFNSGQNGFNRC